MLTRPSLARSIPFWILFIGSLVSAALGVLLVVSNITSIASDIKAQAATAAITLYTGQSWVVLGAALVGAGLIGLIACLLLGVLTSFVPAAAPEASLPDSADEVAPAPVVEPANSAPAMAVASAPGGTAIPAAPPVESAAVPTSDAADAREN